MVATNAVSIRLLASRITNLINCWWSYALSLFGVVRVRHLPTFVSVEPANFCQLRCPECPVGTGANSAARKEVLSMELFNIVLNQIQTTAHTLQFYFQGEPLLNKQLPEMIAKANQLGLYTIVSTNAQVLHPETAKALVNSGLNRIIVSIDGFSQESYEAYRKGGSLQRALEALQFLSQTKKLHNSNIRIELQVLRLRTNEHEWKWIKQNYKKLGATHLVFKTAQLYDYENGNPLMPTQERYARYTKIGENKYIRKKRFTDNSHIKFKPCLRLWSGCVITTSGEVLPCCYDKEHQHSFGNIYQNHLSDIFHSQTAQQIRERVLSKKDMPTMCSNCNC